MDYKLGNIRLIGAADKDYANSCKLALSTIAEFKAIGIEPSLGAFRELIEIFVTQTKRSMILFEIVDELVSCHLLFGAMTEVLT